MGDLQRPIQGNPYAQNVLRQFPCFLIAVAALVGVLATFRAGAQSCGIVQWGAGNGYPPGPYSSPVAACEIRNGEVDDASEGWGPGAIVTFSNAHVRASTWGGTPTGGYPGSGVSCGYTNTITGPDISSPVVFDPGNSLPWVFAIVPPDSCPKANAATSTCKAEDSVGGDQTQPQTWKDLYQSYLRYRNCDDGALGEAHGKFVVYLFTAKWDQVGDLVSLAKPHQSFGRFVLHHVDGLMTPDQAKLIEANATSHCPKGAATLCGRIVERLKVL